MLMQVIHYISVKISVLPEMLIKIQIYIMNYNIIVRTFFLGLRVLNVFPCAEGFKCI